MQIQQNPQQPVKVLILGGTNFMGKAFVDCLIKMKVMPSVLCCINRGKIYWNNQVYQTNPQLKHFYCDRKQHKDSIATIKFVSNHFKINQTNKWTCVVDFCAFKWRDVQSVTKAIADIAERYVFISTDSIYNISSRKFKKPIRQDDFDMEYEYQQYKINNKNKDSYGYNKMKCQIYLKRIKPLPYVCLRLPDVIGPYDNTQRFWCTLKWIKESKNYPLPLSAEDQNQPLSFVDSLSVAKILVELMKISHLPSTEYNLCFNQSVTFKQFADMIAQQIEPMFKIQYRLQISQSSDNYYPSVQCGRIDCSRAIRQLKWSPHSLKQAIHQSYLFFTHSAHKFDNQRKLMQKQFKKKVIGKNN